MKRIRSHNPRKPKRLLLLAAACVTAALLCAVFLVHALGEDPEVEYIYFDLAAGNVTVSGSSYSGSVYKNNGDGTFTKTAVSGTLQTGQAYYVYQSTGGESSPDGYFTEETDGEGNTVVTYTLPERAPVTVDGKSWAEYITNNTDVNAVIEKWNTSSGRTATGYYISVSGAVDAVLVIDNVYSTYAQQSTARTTGGISFHMAGTSAKSTLTIQTVGDNRLGSIHYATGNYTNKKLIIEELRAGSTLTVADKNTTCNDNYWNAAIGSADSYDHSKGIVIRGGTVYAGTTVANDCTAIGAGGNGYGVITIEGGTVTAVTSSSGTAIGGGIGKTSSGGQADVTITGGTVYAYNFSCSSGSYSQQKVAYIPAAAIGGGSSARATCNPSTVTITGGRVYAQSVGGTAIGGGSSADNSGGSSTVVIGGDAYVEAKSISGTIAGNEVPAGVAIGGGTGGKAQGKNGGNVTLTIRDNPTVIVGSIGGGKTISPSGKIGSATVRISGGTIQGQIIMAAGASTSCLLEMSGGSIDNSARQSSFIFLEENGGAIYMDDPNGTATLSGGSITGCSAVCGGALYMTAGSFTLSGTGSISSCSAEQNGGAVYMGGGTFEMTGGSISDNTATLGAGAYLENGTMTISGGSVDGNVASESGGAAFLGGGELTVSGGTVTQNEAQNGAGAYLLDGLMTVSDSGSIESNAASANGGALYMGGGTFEMSGGAIDGNTALDGAGAYLVSGTMTVSGGAIESNAATQNGGGAYLGGGTLTLSGGSVSYNTSVSGAGAYLAGGSFTVTGGTVARNTAESGAGAYLRSGTMTVAGGTITRNEAQNGAGAYLLDGDMTVSDGSIAENAASANGGALYMGGGTFEMSGGAIDGNTALDGAGAYLVSGTMTVSGGAIESNTATQNGGGAYLGGGSLTVSGGTVTLNVADRGAGAYLSGGTFTVTAGTISENEAALGAGAYLESGTMTVSGGTITRNEAQNGAGAYLLNGEMTVTGSGSIAENAAEQSGGALYMGGGVFEISGGSISENLAVRGAGAYLEEGTMRVSGGAITGNVASESGGAAYLGGGDLTVSGGTVTQNQAENGAGAYLADGGMAVTGGELAENIASSDGGGAYLAGGTLTVSGGLISKNEAQNGAGAFVANGDVIVTGGTVSENVADVDGGAFAISNGNYTMTSGLLTKNEAVGGDGGAIYVSSSRENTSILVRSGEITYNKAGRSGGALGVYGQAGVEFTITIGSKTSHAGLDNAHSCLTRSASGSEPCPIVEHNSSAESGGAIYLSGSYDAVMNMHCLVESGNVVGDGVSPSNFMKVDGGTLNISTVDGNQEDCGNVVIGSTIEVSGGRVTLSGSGANPRFEAPVTVDVDTEQDAIFEDTREGGHVRTIQYFENNEKTAEDTEGQYVLFDSLSTEPHQVHASMYTIEGRVMVGWMLMRVDENGDHVPTGTVYKPEQWVRDYEGDLIFYAQWEDHGYSVQFVSGVSSYEGEMAVQSFAYAEVKALTLNAYVNPGYLFAYWEDRDHLDGEGDPLRYTDGQTVSKLTDVHDATVTLTAVWIVCKHEDIESCPLMTSTNSVRRECVCRGYSETVSLPSVTGTYREGEALSTAPEYDIPKPITGTYAEKRWENLAVTYSGTTNGGETLTDAIDPPTEAGQYVASVEVTDGVIITATVVIGRADRTDVPSAPEFDDSQKDANGDTVITITDAYSELLEYRFVYYDANGVPHGEQDWLRNDPSTPLSKTLEEIYTKYYVDVRFAMTPNYNPSAPIRGSFAISLGNISFKFLAGAGVLVVGGDSEDSIDERSITVEVFGADGYFIPTLSPSFENPSGFSGFESNASFDSVSGKWIYRIANIQNPAEDVEITVTLSGAVLSVTVESSTVKDEAFDDITGRAEDAVSISRDSAYSVHFGISRYHTSYYSAPAVSFSQALPIGTRVIMLDRSDGSYWAYIASASVTSIPLSEFVRMGSADAEDDIDLSGRDSLSLQFIVDFSYCQSAPAFNALETSFTATAGATSPALPADGSAVSQISLLESPRFSLGATEDGEALSETVAYEFAVIDEDGIGVSAWERVGGILVLVPTGSTPLPPDARLEVKIIGGPTTVYSMTGGRFTVALPAVGGGRMTIRLLSDLFPNANVTYRLSGSLYASSTKVRTTPIGASLSPQAVTLSYSVSEVTVPVIHAEMVGEAPMYDGERVSSLTLSGEVLGLQNGDAVRAVLYFKNENGAYDSTSQELEPDAFVFDGNHFTATLGLASFAEDMRYAKGSLSLMLRVEVVEVTDGEIGETKASVPLYFVLVDGRP